MLPPTPKSTPLFMTPDVTPPNEAQQEWNLFMDLGKPPIPKITTKIPVLNKVESAMLSPRHNKSYSPLQSLLQPQPVPQMLVIERMHSGARRFVTLDFSEPIVLTDLMIPACGDLASMSIDGWVQGEDIDCQRLVVATDINTLPLIMTDIVPPLIVRFLKITIIGRYGGNTTRSKIPIGSFYGYTLITSLDWQESTQNLATSGNVVNDTILVSQQIGVISSIQEDIHCRYSLAKSRLQSLLSSIESSLDEHSNCFIRENHKNSNHDAKVTQAYTDCVQLQQQLNLSQNVLQRLYRMYGRTQKPMTSLTPTTHDFMTSGLPTQNSMTSGLPTQNSMMSGLPTQNSMTSSASPTQNSMTSSRHKRTMTDKLRVLIEHLLDMILTTTIAQPAGIILPCLKTRLSMDVCRGLFSQLCVNGTTRMQVHAGILLMRVGGSQSWWGDFLSSLLQQYFSSQQTLIFPQDRLFVQLTVLGCKSLRGPNAPSIIQSLLTTLAQILSPLVPSNSPSNVYRGCLDLSLIGWILMFLCRNLDNGSNCDDPEKGAAKYSGSSLPNRWSFIEGDSTCPPKKSKRATYGKAYAKTVHKRLFHHKQKLLELESAKKKMLEKQQDVLGKVQTQLFKKEFSNYTAKHLKDLIQMRRVINGEMSRSSKDSPSKGASAANYKGDKDTRLILPPDKCLPVVKGLLALLLSMDVTCNSDLFLITCKVFARLCTSTRPTIPLTDVMSQTQLEQLISVCVNVNTDSMTGGNAAWAEHAITCLLQDIIEGEKLYPSGMSVEGVTDDEISGADILISDDRSDTDEIEEATSSPKPPHVEFNDDYDDDWEEKEDIYQPIDAMVQALPTTKHLWGNIAAASAGTHPPPPTFDKKQKFQQWKKIDMENSNPVKKGLYVSSAQDARLEYGLSTQGEIRLKAMQSIYASYIKIALVQAIPYPNNTEHDVDTTSSVPSSYSNLHTPNSTTSISLLGTSFDNLYSLLSNQRINLDNLLRLWLKLNDDNTSHDENMNLDVSRTPQISLSVASASYLIHYLTTTPIVPLSTWVLSLNVLSLLCNQRAGDDSSSIAMLILTDNRLPEMLIRFLSGTSLPGMSTSQVGPTATQGFYDFLMRLQIKCPNNQEQIVKDLMLRLVYILTDDRGAIKCAFGPQDVQCKFLEFVLNLSYDHIEITNALSVVQCISDLVYHHIISQDPISCRSSSENPVNARQCFGSMFANVLRMSDNQPGISDQTRDVLMGSLLSLVSSMIQIPAPSNSQTTNNIDILRLDSDTDLTQYQSMTDTNKLNQASATTDNRNVIGPTSSDTSLLSATSLYSNDSDVYATASENLHEPDYTALSQSDEQKSVAVAAISRSDEQPITQIDNGLLATAGARTDEQKSETLLSQINIPQPTPVVVTVELTPTPPSSSFGNVVIRHEHIMSNLLHSLGHCNGNMMAVIVSSCGLPSNLQDSFLGNETLSVGDGIYQLLCNLHKTSGHRDLMISALHKYLHGDGSLNRGAKSQLSEPLIWFILKVLDSDVAIASFIEMGGVETICDHLTQSSPRFISGGRGLVSTVLQNMNLGKEAPQAQRKTMLPLANYASSLDLRNFAPLGTITSSSPTASPPDVLIQSAPPHRRARSPAWSYHFYPNESWVDLTIQLPFAILLKEVHIQPHAATLNSCPAYVSLEVSHNGSICTPVSQPSFTSSLSFIKLQLHKAQVVTNVTLRLHKARDSFTIGLSQILLMGCSTFADTSFSSVSDKLPMDSLVSKTSLGWLRLLHHVLTTQDQQSTVAINRAAQCPQLLSTCLNLLAPTTPAIYYPNIESVLLKLGLHSPDMSLNLINNILQRQVSTGLDHATVFLDGTNGSANESSVEILYRLGITQDQFTQQRIQALIDWLLHCSHPSPSTTLHPHTSPAVVHVHCIAAVLWKSHDISVHYELKSLITERLVSSMYNWSHHLVDNTRLKRMVDYVLCSLCRIRPDLYQLVLQWIGINDTHNASDDTKDSSSHLIGQNNALTDDTKNAIGQGLTDIDRSERMAGFMWSKSELTSLAIVSKSSEAIVQLLSTDFLPMLTQGVYEFCMGNMRPEDNNVNRAHTVTLTPELVTNILDFFTELADDSLMKDWLGGAQGNVFWTELLALLCDHAPYQQMGASFIGGHLDDDSRSQLESATIAFFSAVIFCHENNQRLFAKVLCDIIRSHDSEDKTALVVLSGFTRRLFLQVLLEDERLLVGVTSTCRQIKGARSKASACIQHPRYGAGRMNCMLRVSLHDTISHLLSSITEIPQLAAELLSHTDKASADDDTKDSAEIGMEFMEFLSNAAGLSAKAKRDKSIKGNMPPRPPTRRGHYMDHMTPGLEVPTLHLYHKLIFKQELPGDLTISQLITILRQHGLPLGTASLQFMLKITMTPNGATGSSQQDFYTDPTIDSLAAEILLETPPCHTALHMFASIGGLALLAEHLPIYPEVTKPPFIPDTAQLDSQTSQMTDPAYDWVTVESSDDYYEQLYEPTTTGGQPTSTTSRMNRASTLPAIPPHSLIAFGLFLRLPGYADVLLKERKKAQCLLRLVLGVSDDGDGGHILLSPTATTLPTLPFHVLKSLFDETSPTTDDGVLLRRMALEIGVLHLLLACLSVLSHHAPRSTSHTPNSEGGPEVLSTLQSMAQNTINTSMSDDKAQNYWAKGTGFGTGSTTSNWDSELASIRQRSEEEHVTVLLQVLASYIGGPDTTPHCSPLLDILNQSCLVPAVCSYLRNDSVLDMARHVPLYRSLLQLLRSIATTSALLSLLLQPDGGYPTCIASLLQKMCDCVDTYSSRLKSNKGKSESAVEEIEEESEGLALLIPDIQVTAAKVKDATDGLLGLLDAYNANPDSNQPHINGDGEIDREQQYVSIMKPLQFDTFEFIIEDCGTLKFTSSHHYESNVKSSGDVSNPSRARRLAQEAVTLSTSLPLSASSSVFVRCDEERLDVMKVLITGPSDTPYANGCFEFDVYFPSDYPVSPPSINLETTGNRTIRFNPNLYNDGKVCLSVLNTWHGRPEEKWNAQTSSFLQVLVSIQSLILVSEPYFNEPGYERSRGTPSGMASSREYDANIRQATVKWAMLAQLKNPSPCFKEVIERHFWLKRHEILEQCESWISDLENCDKKTARTIPHNTMALKRHYNELREQLSKLMPHDGFPNDPIPSPIDPQAHHYVTDSNNARSNHQTHDSLVVNLPEITAHQDMALDIIEDTLAGLGAEDLVAPSNVPMDQLPAVFYNLNTAFGDKLTAISDNLDQIFDNHDLDDPVMSLAASGQLTNANYFDVMSASANKSSNKFFTQNPPEFFLPGSEVFSQYYKAQNAALDDSGGHYMDLPDVIDSNYFMANNLPVASNKYFLPDSPTSGGTTNLNPPDLPNANYYGDPTSNYYGETSNSPLKPFTTEITEPPQLPVNGIADYSEIVPFLSDQSGISNEHSPLADDADFPYMVAIDPFLSQDEVDC